MIDKDKLQNYYYNDEKLAIKEEEKYSKIKVYKIILTNIIIISLCILMLA